MSQEIADSMFHDPLIDEVRQRRRDLFAACGRHLDKLAQLIRQREADHPEKVIHPRTLATARRAGEWQACTKWS